MRAIEILIVAAGVGLLTLAAFLRGNPSQGNIIVAGFMCFTTAAIVHVLRK